ncbi:MAG: ribonuclease activity regulator RraA [Gammaproteobacteria bacterium]
MPRRDPKPESLEMLRDVSTATIANSLLSRGFKNVCLQGLQALDRTQPSMVGPAYTLRFIPAREDLDDMSNYASDDNLHRRAIEECPPGAVLVIDAGGSSKASSAGDVMAARLGYRGAAGIVTDGGYRDTPGIVATKLPAYQAMTASPATVIALHPVELDGPIGCAGVGIYPGDIIVGDADGVVAIPAALADEVATAAYEVAQYERYVDIQIAKGRPIFGLFPATEENQAEFEKWRQAGEPEN